MPAVLAFGRLRQEDYEFKASLCYIVRLCLKEAKNLKKKKKKVEIAGKVLVSNVKLLVSPPVVLPLWLPELTTMSWKGDCSQKKWELQK
jgi:hypothetical protein